MPFSLLRAFLGLLCVAFAHFLGRAIVRRQRRRIPLSSLINWALRTAVTALAVVWRAGADNLAFLVFVLAVVAGALGYYAELRPKKQEDLTRVIFPEQ